MLVVDGNLVYELDVECARKKSIDLSKIPAYEVKNTASKQTGQRNVQVKNGQEMLADQDSPAPPEHLTGQEDQSEEKIPLTGKTHTEKKQEELVEKYTGKGVCVAVLDTGVYPHGDFANRIIYFADMVQGRNSPYDDNGHGTHVTGILGGDGRLSNGRFKGIAPGVQLVCIKVLDGKGRGRLSYMLKGIRWVLQNQKRFQIRIVNISVGALAKDEQENRLLMDGILQLWNAGMTVCIAAGNEGTSAITTPGISAAAITVGAMDDSEMWDAAGRKYENYSGRGPTMDCICKPEIVAPGTGIISTNCMSKQGSKPYSVKSGTSMSVPFVSGAIACLLEKYPEMTNTEIKLRLRERAKDLGLPKNHQGWGGLDIESLLK